MPKSLKAFLTIVLHSAYTAMRGTIVFILCIISAINALAQDTTAQKFHLWQRPEYRFAETYQGLNILRPEEKELVRLINLLRMNPSLYGATYLKWYSNISDSSRVRKMQEILNRAPIMPPLQGHIALCKAARFQAYLKINGQDEGGVLPFYERLHQFYPGCKYYATEYLPNDEFPILIINKLLLDSTKSWRSHILSKRLALIGVSITPKIDECYHTVLDFSSAQAPPLPPIKGKKNYNYEDECPKGSKVRTQKPRKKRMRFLFW